MTASPSVSRPDGGCVDVAVDVYAERVVNADIVGIPDYELGDDPESTVIVVWELF